MRRGRGVCWFYLEKVTVGEWWTWVPSSTKINFMSIRNASSRVPQRLHMNSDVFGLSNSEHIHRNVQSCIRTSNVMRWWCGEPVTEGVIVPCDLHWFAMVKIISSQLWSPFVIQSAMRQYVISFYCCGTWQGVKYCFGRWSKWPMLLSVRLDIDVTGLHWF